MIGSRILLVRGQKVLVDADLAELYGVSTKRLNEAVKRNSERFPEDFMFRLSASERDQVVAHCEHLARLKYSKQTPLVFTEQGVAMLSSVLRSPRAVAVNIEIMRAFVRLRHLIASSDDLARRIEELDAKYDAKSKEHAAHIQQIYDLLDQLMNPPEAPKKKPIGFRPHDEDDGKTSGRRMARKARVSAS
ncbi:MAG TPA: ORF6N domain-containing protein [Polyangiaceae bacterium]|nr:ORF6N domain-containing protein [Polyangiaceae bacterium]